MSSVNIETKSSSNQITLNHQQSHDCDKYIFPHICSMKKSASFPCNWIYPSWDRHRDGHGEIDRQTYRQRRMYFQYLQI